MTHRRVLRDTVPSEVPDALAHVRRRLQVGLAADRCVADPGPFSVTFLDGEAVAISVDRAAVDALGLAEGTWWTAWSDGISCERVVASFEGTAPGVTP